MECRILPNSRRLGQGGGSPRDPRVHTLAHIFPLPTLGAFSFGSHCNCKLLHGEMGPFLPFKKHMPLPTFTQAKLYPAWEGGSKVCFG